MIENYVNTTEAIQLFVYADGQRVSADQTPTATAVDLNSNDPVTLTSVVVQNHPDGYDYYEVSLDPSEVTTTRRIAVTWEYVYNSYTFNRTEIVEVIRPYFEADDFWSRYPEFSDSGADPLTLDKVQELERRVRGIVNQYCGQEFQDYGLKTKRVRGNGTNSLQLPDRIYYLESLKSGELVLFERDGNGDITTELATWYEEEPYLISKKGPEHPHITFSDQHTTDTAVSRTRSLFNSDRLYEVEAKYGWEYLPGEVNLASIFIAYEILQSEDRYRQKNITVLRSADYRMEFGADHHTTTGSTDADTLLSKYINDGVFVF